MKIARGVSARKSKDKAPTGILGFDYITNGGLPTGRSTLLIGGPGSGKTIFAAQFLMHGVLHCNEPGIFVAFEEAPARIISNFAGFGWKLDSVPASRLFFMDAQPTPDFIQAGDFDIGGMLAALGAQARSMKATRIVFDALDIIMALLPDAAARRREIYRLHDWLLLNGLTGIITAKAGGDEASSLGDGTSGFMQFMVDCAIVLNHRVTLGVSQRNMRVQKYRGSAFDENEAPYVIGTEGFDVAVARARGRVDANVSSERVSSGIKRLDTMLGGGYYRGSSVLIAGFPGTAKTTLGGAFAEAACSRGERTVFVSFDSDGAELVRNLTSVAIQLGRFLKNGLLLVVSARNQVGSAETMLAHIKSAATAHRARCVVIDPVSALSSAGNELTAHNVSERLIDWCKAQGITLVCTSLVDTSAGQMGAGTPLHISTLADTWIQLNYLVQAGERNRGMSIIKSRGTAHSNQVRELILNDSGITLADIYTARGEVLMGTLRWEKESTEGIENEHARVQSKLERVRLDAEQAELEVRLKSLQTELVAKQLEKELLARTTENLKVGVSRRSAQMRELRGADTVKPGGKPR